MSIGLISIASIMASPFSGTEQGIGDYLERLNLEYVNRQVVNFLVGLAAMLFFMIIDYNMLKPLINVFYIGNVLLLLVLFVVEKTRGVSGWFVFETIDRALQPGELCKICIIVMLSKIVSEAVEKDGSIKKIKDISLCLAFCLGPTLLVMLQPDFGTAFVYVCIMVAILFIAKINWKYILGAALILGAGLPIGYFFLMNDDQQGRINVFLNPETDVKGSGYNVIQSKVSIGSGQLWGKGFFSQGTLAQLKYVPERHTDFIFAGIVEGIGFIGGTVIILLFLFLLLRWIWIALKAKDAFGTCLVVGVIGMMLAHVFENIGMTMGVMPVTGIPLPFISYGGSNLLTNMIALGIVMNVWIRRPAKR